MLPSLLTTKFHIPLRRPGLIERPRLLKELQRGLDEHHKLILISAPAGYGKTTLIADWINNLQHEMNGPKIKISWLSLDEADNEPRRFLHYFLTAFQQADKSLGAILQGMLQLPNLPPLPILLNHLLNDLAETNIPRVLVIDDYHCIINPEIHAALAHFLEHQPASTHLVLTTRTDPPLLLARFRARRQMTEIRSRDLRFSLHESRTFFCLANLPLTENALNDLDERTEGWAAGIQLAALALQYQPNPAAFIKSFRGSHRYVLDYLAEEVLQQQSEEMRLFLVQTSPLARFNAELCNTLTGREDSQLLITQLELANLFIIPLDNNRIWYRYHHLFADYLRSLLSKPELTALYQKAAIWHEENGLTSEAVHYALACDKHNFATRIIENALEKNSTWSDGNLGQLVAWLEASPQDAFKSRPRLGLHAARAFYLQGLFTRAEEYLTQAEHYLQTQPETDDTKQLLAIANLHRGAIASVRGEFHKVLALVPAAQSCIPPENNLVHARAFFSLGIAHENAGNIGHAVENYLRASKEARTAGVSFLAVNSLCSAAQAQIQQGFLRLAEQTCQDAIHLVGGTRIPPLGLAWVILGTLALERNDLSSAENYLIDGITLSRQGELRADLITGLFSLGLLKTYHGDQTGMQAVMNEALSVIRSIDIPRIEQLAYARIARYQHFLGQSEAAFRWADEYQSRRAEAPDEFADLTLVRILLSSGDLERISSILPPIMEKAKVSGRWQAVIETMLLLGLYHHARGETATALELIKKALKLAAPEGYLRLFLDEGRTLLNLLPKVRFIAPNLVDAILSSNLDESGVFSKPLDRLTDPLTGQEIRVLKLIVAGKSNTEIAAELVISVGTAKWHVHNVLQKLGVGNRPQAIARARELGI